MSWLATCRSGDCRTWSLPSLHSKSPSSLSQSLGEVDIFYLNTLWKFSSCWGQGERKAPLHRLPHVKPHQNSSVICDDSVCESCCGWWNVQESCSLQTKHGAFVPFIFPSEFVWHLHEHLLSWGVHLESLDLLMTPGLANSKANHGFRLIICLSDITSFLIFDNMFKSTLELRYTSL